MEVYQHSLRLCGGLNKGGLEVDAGDDRVVGVVDLEGSLVGSRKSEVRDGDGVREALSSGLDRASLDFAVSEVELGEGRAGWVAPGDQERGVSAVKSNTDQVSSDADGNVLTDDDGIGVDGQGGDGERIVDTSFAWLESSCGLTQDDHANEADEEKEE